MTEFHLPGKSSGVRSVGGVIASPFVFLWRFLRGLFRFVIRVTTIVLVVGIVALAGVICALMVKPELVPVFKESTSKVIQGMTGMEPSEIRAEKNRLIKSVAVYLPDSLEERLTSALEDSVDNGVETPETTTQEVTAPVVTSPAEVGLVLSRIEVISEKIEGSSLSRVEKLGLATLVVSESTKLQYDALMAAAVMMAESKFNPSFQGPEGGIGLFQIPADQGEYMAKLSGIDWEGEAMLKDPQYNIKLGLSYLKFLDKIFKGNSRAVLMARKMGAREYIDAQKRGGAFPESGVTFVDSVIQNYESLKSKP